MIFGAVVLWFCIQKENEAKPESNFKVDQSSHFLHALPFEPLYKNHLVWQINKLLAENEMGLHDVELTPDQMTKVAEKATSLRRLRLSNCTGCSAKNLEILRRTKIISVVITRCSDFTSSGLEAISRFENLQAIELDDPTGNGEQPYIGGDDIAVLKNAPLLREVSLRNMPADKETIRVLSDMKLRLIELGNNQQFDENNLALLQNSEITELRLNNLNVTDTGFEMVSNIPTLVLLQATNLKITDRGFMFLDKMPKLCSFTVGGNQGITDRSTKILYSIFSHYPRPESVEYRLDNTSVTSLSVPELKKLRGIKTLGLTGLKGFDNKVLADLQRALPGTLLERLPDLSKEETSRRKSKEYAL